MMSFLVFSLKIDPLRVVFDREVFDRVVFERVLERVFDRALERVGTGLPEDLVRAARVDLLEADLEVAFFLALK